MSKEKSLSVMLAADEAEPSSASALINIYTQWERIVAVEKPTIIYKLIFTSAKKVVSSSRNHMKLGGQNRPRYILVQMQMHLFF